MCARGYPRRIFYYIHLLAAAFRTAHNPRHIVCSRTARIYHDRARYVYIYISIRAPCPQLCAPRVHHKIGRFCALFFTKHCSLRGFAAPSQNTILCIVPLYSHPIPLPRSCPLAPPRRVHPKGAARSANAYKYVAAQSAPRLIAAERH